MIMGACRVTNGIWGAISDVGSTAPIGVLRNERLWLSRTDGAKS